MNDMENYAPVIIEKDLNNYIIFSTVFYCFDSLINIPESRAWPYVVELHEFDAARFHVLLHRIETLQTVDVAMDEVDAIITLAVFHFISLSYFYDDEEEIIRTKCEDWIYISVSEQRPDVLRYSTELIAMLKQRCLSLPRFAAVVKWLES